jgi:hypothetical protein
VYPGCFGERHEVAQSDASGQDVTRLDIIFYTTHAHISFYRVLAIQTPRIGWAADSIVTLYEALDTAASSFSITRCASNFSSSVGG